jgi:hypothetical protein
MGQLEETLQVRRRLRVALYELLLPDEAACVRMCLCARASQVEFTGWQPEESLQVCLFLMCGCVSYIPAKAVCTVYMSVFLFLYVGAYGVMSSRKVCMRVCFFCCCSHTCTHICTYVRILGYTPGSFARHDQIYACVHVCGRYDHLNTCVRTCVCTSCSHC